MGKFCLAKSQYSPNRVKFSIGVHCILIMVLMLIFIKLLHSFSWSNFCPKIWCSLIYLKMSTEVHCYMLITIVTFSFQLFSHSSFLGKFGPRIWYSPNWLRFSARVNCFMLIKVLNFFSIYFFWLDLVQNWLKFGPWVHCYILITIFDMIV